MENVQRQEVKKPILLKDVEVPSEWKDFGQVMLKCPTCGHTWNGFKNHDKYCSECGQKFEEKQTETENEAMEKQIPKKPVFLEPFEVEGFNETIDDLWDCPGCGHTWGSEKGLLKYCPECGQKFDWNVSKGEKKMIYRYKFSGMVVIPNNEEEIAMYLSVEIPVDYQTEEQAKHCPCSLRFESDENKEIVLKIYENFKQGLDDKKGYYCSVSGNVVATVHWNDRAKYKYHQSISDNDVPEYEKTWNEIFETYIKSNKNYTQTVDSLAYGIICLDEKER